MKLSADLLNRHGYRLPTEAEWEYACRSGTVTARFFGETDALLTHYVWYSENSRDRWMLPVGSLKPNDFGLFDMLGNAFEWCQDRAGLYPTDRPVVDDAAPDEQVQPSIARPLRGGAFADTARYTRSADRGGQQPAFNNLTYGFRVARTWP